MASRSHSNWDTIADGRSSVTSELEAIFAPLPRLAPPIEQPASPKAAAATRGPGRWFGLVGAVVLAALIGSLVFLTPVVRQAPPQPAPKAVSATFLAPPPTANSVAVQPAPPHRAVPTVKPKAAPARASHQPKLIPAEAPHHDKVTTTPAALKPKVAPDRAQQQTASPSCPRSATEAWCLQGTVVTADTELRDAYDKAVQAGVDRRALVDIRNDWKRLRKRANKDPRALIRGYAALTQELRTATHGAQR
jgi:hypothetical protein